MAINIKRSLRYMVFILNIIVIIAVDSTGFSAVTPAGPILRIETKTHAGRITSMDVSENNARRFVVTGSVDKAVRIWEFKEQKMEHKQTLWPAQNDGGVGKIYAVAISPDGRMIACGGWTVSVKKKFNIYIYKYQRSANKFEFIQTIPELPASVTHLAFSNKYLIAGFSGKKGIRIYRSSDFAPVEKYEDKDDVNGSRVTGIGFLLNDVITISEDGHLRRYDASLMKAGSKIEPKEYMLKSTPTDTTTMNPTSLSISKSGRIAVGFDPTKPAPSPHVCIYVMPEKKELVKKTCTLYALGDKIRREPLTKVMWSSDDKFLYALGSDRSIYRYDDSDINNGTLIESKDRLVEKENGSIDGFVMSSNHLIYVYNSINMGFSTLTDKKAAGGEPVKSKAVNFKDLREAMNESFIVSDDGQKIQYVDSSSQLHSVSVSKDDDSRYIDKSSAYSFGVSTVFSSANTTNGELKISEMCEKFSIDKGFIELDVPPIRREVEKEGCVGASANSEVFLLGTSWNLRLYDKHGKEQALLSLPASAYATRLAQNGRLAIAALGDGTIRWYRIIDKPDDGKISWYNIIDRMDKDKKLKKEFVEILAFFPLSGTQDGIFWTPSGYFRTKHTDDEKIKENTKKYISFHSVSVNGQVVDVVTYGDDKYDRIYDRFEKNNLFKLLLDTPNEDEALLKVAEEENSSCGKRTSLRLSAWFPETKDGPYYYRSKGEDDLKKYLTQTLEPTTLVSRETINELLQDLNVYLATATRATRNAEQLVSGTTETVSPAIIREGATIVMPELKLSSRGSWDSEVLAGLSDFIFERAEAEMIRWYVDQFEKQLCTEAIRRIHVLELCKLKTEMQASGRFSKSDLLHALRNDMETLSSEILCHLNLNRDKQLYAYTLFDVLKEISRGSATANIIAQLGESEEIRKECLNNDNKKRPLTCSLYFSGVVMQAYLSAVQWRGQKTAVYWNDILIVIYDKVTRDIDKYVKCKDKCENPKCGDCKKLRERKKELFVSQVMIKHVDLKRAITKYRDILREQQIIAESLKHLTPGTEKKGFADIFSPALMMCRSVVSIISSIYPVMDVNPDVLKYSDKVSNTAAALASGYYADAARNIRDLINYSSIDTCVEMRIPGMDCTFRTQWIVEQFDDIKKKYDNQAVYNCYKDCSDENNNNTDCSMDCLSMENIANITDKYNKSRTMGNFTTLQPVYKYISVMGELADARTKEDVKTVLNNVASPVGAWALKEQKNSNSIGALVGGQYSYELTPKEPNGLVVGLFAPVGVDITRKFSYIDKPSALYEYVEKGFDSVICGLGFGLWKCGYWGAYISVIDLGNYASARYSSTDEVEAQSDIGWPQVVSLGAYLHWSVKKSPIVYGFGYSYAPRLRAIKMDTGESVYRGSGRIMVFIAVDVTLFPF